MFLENVNNLVFYVDGTYLIYQLKRLAKIMTGVFKASELLCGFSFRARARLTFEDIPVGPTASTGPKTSAHKMNLWCTAPCGNLARVHNFNTSYEISLYKTKNIT